MFCFLQTVIRRQKTFFFLAEKARNLYPSEIGNFAESPRFFVNVCSLKEQSIIIIVDARVLSPSGGYAKLKFFQALLGLDTKLYKTAVQFENSIDDVGPSFMQLKNTAD